MAIIRAFNWKVFKALVDSSDLISETLSKEFEVTPATVLNWKRGINPPPFHKMAIIAEYFNVNLEDLVISPDDFKFPEEQIVEILKKRKKK